jgi:hypothetical protein
VVTYDVIQVMFSKLFEVEVGEEHKCKNAIVGFAKRDEGATQDGRHYMMAMGCSASY